MNNPTAIFPLPSDKKARRAFVVGQSRFLAAVSGMSAESIHKHFEEHYGSIEWATRTFSDFIKGVPKPEYGRPSDRWISSIAVRARQSHLDYLMNLNLLSESIHVDGGLTVPQSEWAVALCEVFNDRQGEKFDLFPQLAIIEEYARRSTMPETPTEDLDKLLECRPWEGDGSFYRAAVESGNARVPFILMFIEDGPPSGGQTVVHPIVIGAIAHLQLPWFAFYRHESRKGDIRTFPALPKGDIDGVTPPSADDFKSQCVWREIVAASWKEKNYARG